MSVKPAVRQVGYLQRLYRDAWSTEHKKVAVRFIQQVTGTFLQ